MSAADGTVAAPVKVIDNGPEESRWDLVIMGDGYRAAELPKFHDDVEQFCAEVLKPTPPFDELWPAINVHRIDVTSTDSGADLPSECGGTGPPRRTFLDAIFCPPPWHIDRLLTVNNVLAFKVAKAVPFRNVILVLVNAEQRGGSGDPGVAVSSNAWAWDIALHELGHSAFNLADEYESDESGGPEPKEPNVTRNTNRATNKWKDLVRATTPMPSTCNADCPRCRPPAHPPAPDAVGTYEGARYQRCGTYRPFPDCYMRSNHTFCPVCVRVIRRTLEPLMP